MNWYCVHTKPAKEALVERYLCEEHKLEVYFPRLRRMRTIRRVRRVAIEPLFPRYLFCRFDFAENYRAVRYGRDIIGLVSSGEKPTHVSDATIEQLKDWANENGDLFEMSPEEIAPGDTVKIVEGPMQGLEAIFLEETGQGERVSILLEMMNAEAQAQIDRSQIEPVNQ